MKKSKGVSVKTLILLALSAILLIFGTTAYLLNSTKSLLTKQEMQALVNNSAPLVGKKDARVTIVEFLNPSCGTCMAFNPTINTILEKNEMQVKVIYRFLPFNHSSDYMIYMLLAANDQGKFKDALNSIFSNMSDWLINGQMNISGAWKLFGQAGVNIEKAQEYLQVNIDTLKEEINQNNKDARSLNINGTPSFYVNDKILSELGEKMLLNLVGSEIERIYR